jgi:hypothetical protein
VTNKDGARDLGAHIAAKQIVQRVPEAMRRHATPELDGPHFPLQAASVLTPAAP